MPLGSIRNAIGLTGFIALSGWIGTGTLLLAAGDTLPNMLPLFDPSGFLATYIPAEDLSISPARSSSPSEPTAGVAAPATARRKVGPFRRPKYNAASSSLRGSTPSSAPMTDRFATKASIPRRLEWRLQAYKLLLERGLIRVAIPVPANAEFTVVSVQNPYGCNDTSTLSMYRRPLPATNLRFLSTVMWDGRESSPQTGTQKITYATNPGDLLADLAHQAVDATTGHAQAAIPPTAQQVQNIVNFEMALSTAQAFDYQAGALNANGAT